MRSIFSDSEVAFAWRPTNESFSDSLPFYNAFKVPLLSDCVTQHLAEIVRVTKSDLSPLVTSSAIKMIAAWLREKRPKTYGKLLSDGVFSELSLISERNTAKDILVDFRLQLNGKNVSRHAQYPVFWNRKDNVLIFNSKAEKDVIAQTLAMGLIGQE